MFLLVDKPDSAALRMHWRPAHKTYLAQVQDRIAFAGPLLAEDGVAMIGSLLAIDFPNRADAFKWLADEPFSRAGLYASTRVDAFLNLWTQRTGFPLSAL